MLQQHNAFVIVLLSDVVALSLLALPEVQRFLRLGFTCKISYIT